MSSVAPWALVAWTLFVWGGRLRNLWLDPGGLAQANRFSLVASMVFVGLAFAVAATLVVGRAFRPVLMALALAGVGVWLVRGVDIALGGHSVGFVAVHLMLAGVTVALSLWAVGSTRISSVRWVNL